MSSDPASSTPGTQGYQWLPSGGEGLSATLTAIAEARHEVLLETYIFTAEPIGERFRDALVAACQRGVRVKVLLDAFGSMRLPTPFWAPVINAGGEFRWFNLFRAGERYGCRNHRKLVVVDRALAFIGGYNIATVYDGDGIDEGWRDLGLRLCGSVVMPLVDSFMAQFTEAETSPRRYVPLRKNADAAISGTGWRLLLFGPGRGHTSLKRSLLGDLHHAQRVEIICAYFLPTWRLRRALTRIARRGGEVRLILAGKSDIFTARLACHNLYTRLLRAGVKIYEYQPQILHAKLFIIDDIVYAGSANLDARSLQLNHELLLRVDQPGLAAGAKEIFAHDLRYSRRIDPAAWKASQRWWRVLIQKAAYFLLARIDPYITSLRWRRRAAKVFNPERSAENPDELAKGAEAR